MKKVMLIFVFMNLRVEAMKKEDLNKESNQIAHTIASSINFNTEKESDKKSRIAHAEDILKNFIKEYPQEKPRNSTFVMLVEYLSKSDIDNLEKKIGSSDLGLWAIKNIKSVYNAVGCLNKFLDTYIDKKNLKEYEILILKSEGIDELILDGSIGKKYAEKIIENISQKNNSLLDAYKNFITTDFDCETKDTLPIDIDFVKNHVKSAKYEILFNASEKYVVRINQYDKDVIQKFLTNPDDITETELRSINLFLENLMEKIYSISPKKNDWNYDLAKDFLQNILAALPFQQFYNIILHNVQLATNNENKNLLFSYVLDVLKRYDRYKTEKSIEETNKITDFFKIIVLSMFNPTFNDVKEKIYKIALENFKFMKELDDPITQLLNKWQPVKIEPVIHRKSWSQYFFNKKVEILLGISTLTTILFLFLIRKELQNALFSFPAKPTVPQIPQKSIDLKDLPFLFNPNS